MPLSIGATVTVCRGRLQIGKSDILAQPSGCEFLRLADEPDSVPDLLVARCNLISATVRAGRPPHHHSASSGVKIGPLTNGRTEISETVPEDGTSVAGALTGDSVGDHPSVLCGGEHCDISATFYHFVFILKFGKQGTVPGPSTK